MVRKYSLCTLATSSLDGLEYERSFIPRLIDQLSVIVQVELGGVPFNRNEGKSARSAASTMILINTVRIEMAAICIK